MPPPSRRISGEVDSQGLALTVIFVTEILAAMAMLTDPMRHFLNRISAGANLTIPAQAAHETRGVSIRLRIAEWKAGARRQRCEMCDLRSAMCDKNPVGAALAANV